MAREIGPRGIHGAHVVIDGQIGGTAVGDEGGRLPDSRLAPDAIAGVYFDLHRQARSAWSQEIDLRPWAERS